VNAKIVWSILIKKPNKLILRFIGFGEELKNSEKSKSHKKASTHPLDK
jgi:hypothetical protein